MLGFTRYIYDCGCMDEASVSYGLSFFGLSVQPNLRIHYSLEERLKSFVAAFFDPLENQFAVFGVAVLLELIGELLTRFNEKRIQRFRFGFQGELVLFDSGSRMFTFH